MLKLIMALFMIQKLQGAGSLDLDKMQLASNRALAVFDKTFCFTYW